MTRAWPHVHCWPLVLPGKHWDLYHNAWQWQPMKAGERTLERPLCLWPPKQRQEVLARGRGGVWSTLGLSAT